MKAQTSTAKLGVKALELFEFWLVSVGVQLGLERVASAPGMLDRALEGFGRFLWSTGRPIYILLHAITALQRATPSLKKRLPCAWQTVSIWEAEEPLQHRTPLPLVVLRAMVALAVHSGELAWAGVLAIAFFGIGRIGEALGASRSALLLPPDLMLDEWERAFLTVISPKTSNRGGGRQQHLLITGEPEVRFLWSCFGGLKQRDSLFVGGARRFRAFWDWCLAALSIPQDVGLSPGSVRGGACVAAYRAGLGVEELRWRMRIRTQDTLRSYLQEATTLSCLSRLSPDSRRRISAANRFYDCALVVEAPRAPPGQ